MEFCARDYAEEELGEPMTPDEVSANIYMWIALDREGRWQWYAELARSETIPSV